MRGARSGAHTQNARCLSLPDVAVIVVGFPMENVDELAPTEGKHKLLLAFGSFRV